MAEMVIFALPNVGMVVIGQTHFLVNLDFLNDVLQKPAEMEGFSQKQDRKTEFPDLQADLIQPQTGPQQSPHLPAIFRNLPKLEVIPARQTHVSL